MHAIAVTTEEQAEQVRQIRNAGREWMTRDTREIGPDEQAAWFRNGGATSARIWLMYEAETAIGYGLLRREGDRVWCSLAVLPQHRGHGYGTAIYRYLALSTAESVWAEILADNTPSLRAALRAGFQLRYAADKVATLEFPK